MSKKLELTGQVFGRLTVIKLNSRVDLNGSRYWECKCSCPSKNIKVVSAARLRNGYCRSCGCLQKEAGASNGKNSAKHGLSVKDTIDNRYYKAWRRIKSRCYIKGSSCYKDYGGRGITLHTCWIEDPVAFVEYVKALPGSSNPELSLDRFPNNNGNYEPGNLRWATKKQQARNTRVSTKPEKVLEIKKYLSQKMPHEMISRWTSCSIGVVRSIASKNAWV